MNMQLHGLFPLLGNIYISNFLTSAERLIKGKHRRLGPGTQWIAAESHKMHACHTLHVTDIQYMFVLHIS